MYKQNHYVPVLKWKRGEQKALEFLDRKFKECFTPLIEIVPIPYDYVNDRPQKTVDEHLKDFGVQLKNSWANERPVYVDLFWLEDNERMNDGSHPVEFILTEARKNNINVIPVTGPSRDNAYNSAIKKAIAIDNLGVCIRLEEDDYLDIDNNIKALLNELKVNPTEVDLVIDFKYVSPTDEKKNILTILSIINSLPFINSWKNLILCSTAFPENLSGIKNDSISTITRSEWIIWKTLYANKVKIKRVPIFGDYSIANPNLIELDPRIMDITANIRYTIEDAWLICKGKSIKRYGGTQFHTLANNLIKQVQYSGPSFSWGDNRIYECAHKKCTPGNPEIWRRVGTNHHIRFVVEQLASFPEI